MEFKICSDGLDLSEKRESSPSYDHCRYSEIHSMYLIQQKLLGWLILIEKLKVGPPFSIFNTNKTSSWNLPLYWYISKSGKWKPAAIVFYYHLVLLRWPEYLFPAIKFCDFGMIQLGVAVSHRSHSIMFLYLFESIVVIFILLKLFFLILKPLLKNVLSPLVFGEE